MSSPTFWAVTESDWLTSTDAQRLAIYIYYNFQESSPRKQTLLYCACLRRIWHLLTDERCRTAIEVAERRADGQVGDEEFFAAHAATSDGWGAMADIAADANYSSPLLGAMPDAGGSAYEVIDGDAQCVGGASSFCTRSTFLRYRARPDAAARMERSEI